MHRDGRSIGVGDGQLFVIVGALDADYIGQAVVKAIGRCVVGQLPGGGSDTEGTEIRSIAGFVRP